MANKHNWRGGPAFGFGKRLLVAAVFAAGALASDGVAQAATGDGLVPDHDIAGPVAGEPGAYRQKVQLVFDGLAGGLVRRRYEVWDAAPSRGLDFVWEPKVAASTSERIAGQGHLVWRRKGRASYDEAAVVAEHRGAFANGKAHGHGSYLERGGLYYVGHWKDGLMDGQGRLQLAGGDEYVGAFRAGRAHGMGRYIDVTGEVFEGPFVRGRRHGRGKTILPGGVSYVSEWTDGVEAEATRRIRIAQRQGGRFAERDEDIRLGITIDRRLPPLPRDAYRPERGDLWYTVRNSGNGLLIEPGDARLMSVWKGNGSIQLQGREEDGASGDEYGVLSLSRGQIVPLKLVLQVQNRSRSSVQVAGLHLDVERSRADLKPAFQVRFGPFGNCNGYPDYKPRMKVENFGWSAAQDTVLELRFPRSGLQFSKRLGVIERTTVADFEQDLAAAGVDTRRLKEIDSKAGYRCRAKGRDACLAEVGRSALFGRLRPDLVSQNTSYVLRGEGRLAFSWLAGNGQRRTASRSFPVLMPLGHVRDLVECGEGGQRQPVTSRTQMLRLDRDRYRLPVSYRTSVRAGRTAQLVLPIAAPKSSEHRFRAIVRLSDGRVVRSRPIRLVYYRPSWFGGSQRDVPPPLTDTTAAGAAAAGGAGLYRVTDTVSGGILNMRRGPGGGHGVILSIPRGAGGIALESCRRGDDGRSRHPWCRVSWQGKSGWVSACCIVDESTGRRPR